MLSNVLAEFELLVVLAARTTTQAIQARMGDLGEVSGEAG